LTALQKLDIIKEIEGGVKPSTICKREDIPKSTVATWLKQRESIRALAEKKAGSKRARSTAHDDLDRSLLIWFKQLRDQGIPVDGPLLLEKANKLLRDMGSDRTVSRAWIDRWKKRHSVGGRRERMVGESSAVSVNMAEVNWKTEVLEPLLREYPKKNVFNMDETGLFYRLMTDKTLNFKGEKRSGGELSKERLTVSVSRCLSDHVSFLALFQKIRLMMTRWWRSLSLIEK